MNRVLSSRAGLLSIVTLAGLAAAAACGSSSGGGTVIPPGDDSDAESGGSSSGATGSSSGNPSGSSSGTTGSSGGSSSGAVSSSSGAPVPDGGCPAQSTITLGAHITFPVSWPAALAISQGTGTVDIWLLSTLTLQGDGGAFTGTAKTCGTNLPAIPLNGTGQDATCCPTCGTGGGGTCTWNQVDVAFNNMEWDSLITTTFPTTGMQTGWNPGDMLDTNTTMGLLGLTVSSYGNNTNPQAWPPAATAVCTGSGKGSTAVFTGTCGSFPGADVTDDDGDGFPGITSNPTPSSTNPMFTLPPTHVSLGAIPPLADQLYIVSRNQLELSGMRMSSCTAGSGTAKITLFDNHVVGCHSTATSTNGDLSFTGPAGACDESQVAFVDGSRTIYGTSESTSTPISASNPVTGMVAVQQLAAGATCAEVRSIPAP